MYIRATPTASSYLLPQVFYSFSKEYPDVTIELLVSNTETIINNLYEGKIDIGIVEGKIKNSNIFSEEIAEDEVVVIASEDNPLALKQPLAIGDLITQSFIMPEAGLGIRELIQDLLDTSGIDTKNLKICMTLGNPELIVQMVQSGIGISFVSKWSVFKTIKEGSIKVLSISDKKLKRKFYLTSIEKERTTMAGKTFWEFTRRFRFFIPF